MKTIRALSIFSLATLLLAGCGGGGGGGSSSSVPGALQAGGSGVDIGQVDDGTGTVVTANFTNALDVNDLNQVIGIAEVTAGAPFTAAMWTVNVSGAATLAPEPLNPIAGNTFSAAFAIDDVNGTAVGMSAKGEQRVAVIWLSGATPTELPPLVPAGNSAAYGISSDGTLVVGEAADAAGATRAVVWAADANGAFTSAPTVLPVSIFASGLDLSTFASASGVARGAANEILIAGEAEAGNLTMHAALWRSTNGGTSYTPIDLGANRIAYAVNGAGLVAGETDDTLAPLSWQVTAGVAAAPVPLAAAGSAVAVNADGRIAGWSGAPSVAATWSGTSPTTLFATESQAFGLNNDAQPLIVGRNGGQGFVKRIN